MPFKATYGVEHGRGRASQSGGGLRTPQCDEILRDFYRFKEKSARAAFADEWVRLMARQLDRTWVVLYELLALIQSDRIYENASYMADGKTCASFEEYWNQVVEKPFETWAELEANYRFAVEFSPDLLKKSFGEASETRREVVMARTMATGPLESHGGAREGAGRRIEEPIDNTLPLMANAAERLNQVRIPNLKKSGGSETADYLTARIARDRPDIFARMRAGEFTSVRQAALAAGIVKPEFSIPIDSQGASRRILNRFRGEPLLELIRVLTNHEGLEVIAPTDDPACAAESLISRFGNEYGCALTRELVRLLGSAANLNPIGNDLSEPAQS